MQKLRSVLLMTIIYLVIVLAGCSPQQTKVSTPAEEHHDLQSQYAAAKINIIPLTEFVYNTKKDINQLRVYVSALDSFDCQQKLPAVFRFELYRKVLRSAKPKGKRVVIWPDINLTNSIENNRQWRDFLRAYEFNLDFESQIDQSYILQVTCFCPNGKRLSSEFAIN